MHYVLWIPVEGPFIMNDWKSKRIWQISSLQGHILILHAPTSPPVDTKYVQFSEDVLPHDIST